MTARGKVALWVVGACLLAAVLLAPVGRAGFCLDAQETWKSYCRDWLVSIVGIETTPWLWLGATVAALLIGALIWRRVGRDETPTESRETPTESRQTPTENRDAPAGRADRHPPADTHA